METDLCKCGHERLYHQGNARSLIDTKGCGVTYCHCSGFERAN